MTEREIEEALKEREGDLPQIFESIFTSLMLHGLEFEKSTGKRYSVDTALAIFRSMTFMLKPLYRDIAIKASVEACRRMLFETKEKMN